MASFLNQWGGLVAMVGGILWSLFHFWWFASAIERPEIQLFSILGIAAMCFFMALSTLYTSGKAGSVVKTGIVVALIGTVAVAMGLFAAVIGLGFLFLIAIFGELLTSIGLAIFSIANLDDKILTRWNALPLIMTLVYVPSWLVDPATLPSSFPPHTTELLAGLYGIGWVLLGYRLWWDRRRPVLQE